MKQQHKMSDQFIKSLCDETDVHQADILWTSQRNMGHSLGDSDFRGSGDKG
jgi:hypothetical protein